MNNPIVKAFKAMLSPINRSVQVVSKSATTLEQLFGKWSPVDYGDTYQYIPTPQQTEYAYATHPIVRACIDLIANTTPVPVLEVGAFDRDGEWVPATGSPALDLIRRPNPYQSGYEFLQDLTIKTLSGGVGYIWKIRNAPGGKLIQLRVLPASWVSPVRPVYGLDPADYYNVTGYAGVVMPQDMIEIRFPGPTDLVSSIGPLASAWKEIWSDLERSNYFSEMLDNLKVPGVVIKADVKDAKSKSAMLRFFEDRVGRGRRGEPLVVEPGESVEVLNPLADLDWPGLMAANESRICSVLGVPPLLVQSRIGLEKATYSNAQQMQSNFYRNTMAAWWSRLEQTLTRGLLQTETLDRRGSGLIFNFAYEALSEFREDRSTDTNIVLSEYSTGVITINEARKALGYEEVAELYQRESQGESQETPANTGDSVSDAPVAPAADSEDVQASALNGAQVASLLQIATAVTEGILTPESALAIMQVAFPTTPIEALQSIVDNLKVSPKQGPDPNTEDNNGANQQV